MPMLYPWLSVYHLVFDKHKSTINRGILVIKGKQDQENFKVPT